MLVVLYTFLSTQRVTADGAHSQWSFVITRNNGWQREYTAWENFPCVQNTNIFCLWKLVTGVKVFMCSMFHITITITLTNICRDKRFLITSLLLSWQAHVCRNKTCLSLWQKWMSRQNFCHNKHMFVLTNICHDKTFVATNIILSWQNFGCGKHTFVATEDMFCHNKHVFVMTKNLSWQKWYLRQLLPIIPNTHFLTRWDQNLYSHLTDMHTLLAGQRLGITCQWRESTAAAAMLGMTLRLDPSLFR